MIESYTGEFTQEQIKTGLSGIICSIGSITVSYEREERSALECLQAIPFIKRNIFEASDEEVSQLRNNSGDYKKIRAFINKDENRIRNILYCNEVPFPEDKKERYLDILSDLAKDCLEVSLEKFKEEIEVLKAKEQEEKFEKIIDERLELAAANRQKLIDESEYKKTDRKSFVERFAPSKERKVLGELSNNTSSNSNIDKDPSPSGSEKRKLDQIKAEEDQEQEESKGKVKWSPNINIVENLKEDNKENTHKRAKGDTPLTR